MSVSEQIMELLALTGNLFDIIPIDKMQDAEAALLKSSAKLPPEILKRLTEDAPLSDRDRGAILKTTVLLF